MDLSKAFDCLPHDLLLLKLKQYGVSDSALNLLVSYISDIKQCVKVGQYTSTFQNMFKCVPQGSILGHVLFNVFLNDIFAFGGILFQQVVGIPMGTNCTPQGFTRHN